MELAKQMFGRQTFVGPCSDDGSQRGILRAFARFPTIYIPSFPLSTYLVISDDNSLLETSHLSTFLGSYWESQSFFPSLLGLDCFQLAIICTLKRHFGVASFAPLHSYASYISMIRLYRIQVNCADNCLLTR